MKRRRGRSLAKSASGYHYDWRVGRRFNVVGYLVGRTVRGSTEAITDLLENNVHSFQRPEASHVELDPLATSLNGHAGQIAIGKIGGERFRMWSGYTCKSPGARDLRGAAAGREEETEGERGDFRFRRDFRGVFATPASNTVLVKLAYWFNI